MLSYPFPADEPHGVAQSLTRTSLAIVAGVCCLLFAAAVYWSVLLDSHRDLQRYTQEHAWQRVTQVSRAVSEQVRSMLAGLDYTLQDMVSDYESGDRASFARAIATAQATYPSGTIVQVSVADAQGMVIYSNLDNPAHAVKGVSIADREHFKAHLQPGSAPLFVGRPLLGRVSGKWSVQLSRALYRDGQFDGVLVLSLSPQYLSRQLQSIADSQRDVILVLREDGAYLARSQQQDDVMGREVPQQRLALFAPGIAQGTYEAQAMPDGTHRLYAWSRVQGFPLLVSTGLDSEAVYGPLNAAIRQSLWRNGIGTALIFLGALLTAWLAWQRRREEAQRRQSEQRFMRLAREVPGGLFQYAVDAQGQPRMRFTNPGFYSMHCLDASLQVQAQGLSGLAAKVHQADLAALHRSITQAIRTRGDWAHRYRVVAPDGMVRWLHGHARPQLEKDGSVLWHGYILDVTRDEALQEALRLSEEQLRLTIGAVRDGLWQWDCVNDRVQWDARCHEMLGLADQALGVFTLAGFVELLHPQDRQRVQSLLEKHLEQGEPFRVEMRLRQADGSWRWVESRGEVTQRGIDGKPLRMMGMHSDIQERVEQTRLVGALLERGSALVLVASPARQAVYANARAAACFGIAAGPVLPPVPLRQLHGSNESFEGFGALYGQLKLQGTVRAEWALRVAGGGLRWFDMQGTLLDPQDPEGNVIWTLFDIDARHQAEAGLAQMRQRMDAIIERFPSGLLVTDGAGQCIVAANRMLVSMLQLPLAPEQLVGEPVQSLVPHLPMPVARVLQCDASVQLPGSGRTVHALSNGRHIEIERLPLSQQGQLLGQCWVFHDVTDYKQRESQLETLASTDALTGASNRRAFLGRMELELEHLRMGLGRPCALVMLDIDHFKRVNDSYGHAVGDEVLKHLVLAVSRQLRADDLQGRLGGEEFAVLLSGVDAQTALRRAEDLRLAVERLSVPVQGLAPIRFTVSLGVCTMEQGDASVAQCLERADAAMYYSKRNGRNQVTCWTPRIPEVAQEAH